MIRKFSVLLLLLTSWSTMAEPVRLPAGFDSDSEPKKVIHLSCGSGFSQKSKFAKYSLFSGTCVTPGSRENRLSYVATLTVSSESEITALGPTDIFISMPENVPLVGVVLSKADSLSFNLGFANMAGYQSVTGHIRGAILGWKLGRLDVTNIVLVRNIFE